MTDESAAPDPAPVKATGSTKSVKRTTGNRAVAPAPAAKPDKLKKRLMLSILILVPLLSIALVVKIFLFPPGKPAQNINVASEAEGAYRKAKMAHDAVFGIEKNTWVDGKDLTPADFEKIKAQVKNLVEASDKMKYLLDLLAEKKKQDSKEQGDILKWWMQIKVWLVDADDVSSDSKPPVYAGFYIPMYQNSKAWEDAQKKLKEITLKKDEILDSPDPKARENAVLQVRELEKTIKDAADTFRKLDDYIKGAVTGDLDAYKLPEIENLREECNRADMAGKQARTLRAQF